MDLTLCPCDQLDSVTPSSESALFSDPLLPDRLPQWFVPRTSVPTVLVYGLPAQAAAVAPGHLA